MGSRIVKEVVFKPGVKERELWGGITRGRDG